MPLCVMSELMLLIAHLSGFICDPVRCKRTYGFYAILFIASLLILQQFEFSISPEVTLNSAAVTFVIAAVISYTWRRESGANAFIIFALTIVLSLAFHLPSKLLSRDAGMLACGLLATGANIVLKGNGRSLLLVCALSVLMFETEKNLLMLITTGYCYFELASNSLDRMMICALFTGFAHGIVNWSTKAKASDAIRA